MAILSNNVATLADFARMSDERGKIATVVEILSETNEILHDMRWMEGNLDTGARVTIRTGLPSAVWTQANSYVVPSKGQTAQTTFNTAMLETYSKVDCRLADQNGNAAAYRLAEDKAHIESMGQSMSHNIFYGDERVNPAVFTGLTPFFDKLTGSTGNNVIDGKGVFGGTAAADSDPLSSMWLVGWGDSTVHGIVPMGSQSGLKASDLGKQVLQEGEGLQESYVSHYIWRGGLAIKDWRHIARIANIKADANVNMVTVNPQFATLPELMTEAMARVPMRSNNESTGSVKYCWYCSRQVKMLLEQTLSRLTAEGALKHEMVGGVMTTTFKGHPIRVVDALAQPASSTVESFLE